ncbi:MAG: MFS transporter, partial [Thermoguttaceae bacterium]|nr:MFS transporter [Thermoguttaceae bacterium]
MQTGLCAVEEGAKSHHLRLCWSGAILSFCAYLILYSTQSMLPFLRDLFHVSDFMVTLTVSVATLSVGLAGPWIGFLGDFIGRRRMLCGCMVILMISTTLVVFTPSFAFFVGCRFLQGFCIAGIFAVTMGYLSSESDPKHIAGTMAWYTTAGIIGSFCGRFFTGVIAAHYSWQLAFGLLAFCTVCGTCVIAFLLPRRDVSAISQGSCSIPPALDPKKSIWESPVWLNLKDRQIQMAYLLGFLMTGTLLASFTYAIFRLEANPYRLSPTQLGLLFTTYILAAMITPFSGKYIDRFGAKTVVSLSFCMILMGSLCTLSPAILPILIGLTLITIGFFIAQLTVISFIGSHAHGAQSTAAGVYLLSYYLGASFGAQSPHPIWAAYGWTWVALMICAMCVLAILIAQFGIRSQSPTIEPVTTSKE